jgi:hypothetical protein
MPTPLISVPMTPPDFFGGGGGASSASAMMSIPVTARLPQTGISKIYARRELAYFLIYIQYVTVFRSARRRLPPTDAPII